MGAYVFTGGENNEVAELTMLVDESGNRIFTDANPAKVTLKGRTVTIGVDTFQMDPPRTIYGAAADKPAAADAHAEIPFAYYVSVDTQDVEQTDGTNWVVV